MRILTSLCAALALVSAADASLILTGLVDGPLSGGTPKGIELYATADIPDLSIYGVELVSNAGSSAGVVETAFSGSLNAGDFYYVATEAVNFAAVFGFAPDLTTNDVNHNGDDDFYIYENGIVIDVWGGSDGVDNTGTAADILDSWAYRLNTTGPSTTFDPAEWTIAAPNSLDGEDAAGTAAAVPFGTYVFIPEPGTATLVLMGLAAASAATMRSRLG